MRVLLWHVHGSWTTAFVQGRHEYFLPVLPDRSEDGRGRARTWDWPESVVELAPEALASLPLDVVVCQRPVELERLVTDWTGRRPGVEIPSVYLEHNAPEGPVNAMVHPAASHEGVTVVHVTHFNDLFWDCGRRRTVVIEHGVVDPGHRYTGELGRAAAVVNDPVSRGRVTGTDLVVALSREIPLDLFGMRSEPLGGRDLPQGRMHAELARRRVYFHPNRWTSLGLSLVEAMFLGLPVVSLSTTEAPEAIPPGAGVCSNRRDVLVAALRELLADPDSARAAGDIGRKWAEERFGLERFLSDWDRLLEEVAA